MLVNMLSERVTTLQICCKYSAKSKTHVKKLLQSIPEKLSKGLVQRDF